MEIVKETIETPEETLASLADALEPEREAPTFHPILMIWQKMLEPAHEQKDTKVTPQWAVRITGTYPNLKFADMGSFQRVYYGLLIELLDILEAEIGTDKECLTYDTPADDAAENAQHYINVLRDWQIHILKAELAWSYDSPTAEVELAALSEVHKMFFGETGVTAFLDNIGFEFTDTDQENLTAALEAVRNEEVNGE